MLLTLHFVVSVCTCSACQIVMFHEVAANRGLCPPAETLCFPHITIYFRRLSDATLQTPGPHVQSTSRSAVPPHASVHVLVASGFVSVPSAEAMSPRGSALEYLSSIDGPFSAWARTGGWCRVTITTADTFSVKHFYIISNWRPLHA